MTLLINIQARRKEALEKMLAEMEDEIAEEERLAQEAEVSLLDLSTCSFPRLPC